MINTKRSNFNYTNFKLPVGKKPAARNIAGKIIIIALLAVLLTGIILAAAIIYMGKENFYVAAINGEKIALKEYNLILTNKVRREIITEFSRRSIDVNDKNFWVNEYDGQVPEELAKQQALKEVVEMKLQQILALNYGIFNDISYNTFLKNFKQENLRRQKAVNNNEVIYGPQQYDEFGYYNYVISNMVTAVKNKFWEAEYKDKVSDDQLKQLYKKTRDQFYTKPLNVKIERIFIDITPQNAYGNSELEKARKVMEEIKLKAGKAEGFENIIESLGEIVDKASAADNNEASAAGELNEKGVTDGEDAAEIKDNLLPEYIQQELDANYLRIEVKGGGSIYRQSSGLSAGDISKVFESSGAEIVGDKIVTRRTLNIIKCLEKEGSGYQSFEEAKQAVMIRFIDKKYDEMLQKLISEAEIILNKPVYERIKLK